MFEISASIPCLVASGLTREFSPPKQEPKVCREPYPGSFAGEPGLARAGKLKGVWGNLSDPLGQVRMAFSHGNSQRTTTVAMFRPRGCKASDCASFQMGHLNSNSRYPSQYRAGDFQKKDLRTRLGLAEDKAEIVLRVNYRNLAEIERAAWFGEAVGLMKLFQSYILRNRLF
ncbi:BgTH12-01041 [Blumeria graminis f. sp. triticale]|nr:BgTH12-01041 [Blumeria graminis f. sp. triticale]